MNVRASVAHDGRRYRYAHGDLAESFRGNLKNRLKLCSGGVGAGGGGFGVEEENDEARLGSILGSCCAALHLFCNPHVAQ